MSNVRPSRPTSQSPRPPCFAYGSTGDVGGSYVQRKTYIKLLLSVVCCLSSVFIFTMTAHAFVGQGEQSASSQELHPDCLSHGGKCLPSAGAGSCPAGTIPLALDNPSAQYNCENNYACCKGTPTTGTTSCPAGQSLTRPGLNATRCGADQCRDKGFLYFTDCMSESDCAANRGTNDGGNIAGCSGEGISCCRMKKNRCNDSSTDPKKIFLCTSPSECTAKLGVPFAGGPSGCGGEYSTCCEFRESDDLNAPILNAGAPLRGYGEGGPTGGTASAVSRTARKYQNINSFCFTEIECSTASGAGAWKKGGSCPNKGNTPQGYCVAPKPEYELQYPLGGVKTIAGLKNFITLIFNYGMGIIIIVAAVLFTYGGLRYMVAAVSNDVQVGKTIMIDSAMGLLMGLGAYAILANVNFNTVNLRDFDVYMINRLSFFDNLYCDAVTPAPGKSVVMFQDAGTPFAPKELDITKGYTLTLADTKCGQEYFIEGADSLSVCSGMGCGGKGACLNCSGGTSNCKSSSEKEHVCFDANIGGNVLLGYPLLENLEGRWGNKYIKAYAFCINDDAVESGRVFTEVGHSENMVDKVKTNGASNGAMATYTMKLDFSKVEEIKKKCTGKSGLILEHHLDTDWKVLNGGFGVHVYYYVNRGCSFTNNTTDIFKVYGNFTIDKAINKMHQESPANYDWTFSNAWTLDTALASKNQPIICDINLGTPSTDKGYWHGL